MSEQRGVPGAESGEAIAMMSAQQARALGGELPRPEPVAPSEPHELAWQVRLRDPDDCRRRVADLPHGPRRSVLEARLAYAEGRLDEALRHTHAADAGLQAPSVWRARLLETRGGVLSELGLDTRAQEFLSEAWSVYQEIDDPVGLAAIRQNIATLRFQPKETAYQLYCEARDAALAVGQRDLYALVLLNLLGLAAEFGVTMVERQAYAEESYEILSREWPDMAPYARCAQLRLALEAGDLERAADVAGSLPTPADVADRIIRSHVAETTADYLVTVGRSAQAAELLRATLATELQPEDSVLLRHQLADALHRSGRVAEAYDISRDAFELLQGVRLDEASMAARALDVFHRTSLLRQEQRTEQERADALERALGELRLATKQVHELSIRDTVTGLHNRQHLLEQAAVVLRGASLEAPAHVALLDLDHFKSVNDTHGHLTGDHVLAAFARTLRDSLRPTDLVARYGGEEFVVIRPPGSDDAGGAGRTLCEDLERLRVRLVGGWALGPDGHGLPRVTMSVGVTALCDRALESGLARADRLMYSAKAGGRDQVRCDRGRCPAHPVADGGR